MWQRIGVLVRKEFLQTLPNPRARLLLAVPPIMQFLIFGFAANLDIENARGAFQDGDRTPPKPQFEGGLRCLALLRSDA